MQTLDGVAFHSGRKQILLVFFNVVESGVSEAKEHITLRIFFPGIISLRSLVSSMFWLQRFEPLRSSF